MTQKLSPMDQFKRDEIAHLIRRLRLQCREEGLGSIRFEVRVGEKISEFLVQCKTPISREALERLTVRCGYRSNGYVENYWPTGSRTTKELQKDEDNVPSDS